MPKLIAYLIDHSQELFGPSVIHLFDEKASTRLYSDTDESDSLNSIQEGGLITSNCSVNKVDDISIGSFERVLIEDNSCSSNISSPCKEETAFDNKMSLSNLSRDSGLTLSDIQLYNPEDGESESSENFICPASLTSRLQPHLTKSVPHLDSTNHENAINVTFSYGRSVGVSIDGSCYDVVRKRRHIDPFGRSKINSPMSPYHLSSNGQSLFFSNNNHNEFKGYQNNPYSLLQYSKSYSCGMNSNKAENYQNVKNKASRYPLNEQRYRLKRPPLTALLQTQSINPSNSIRSLSHNSENLQKAFSEKILMKNFEESDSLSHQCKLSPKVVEVDPHFNSTSSTGNHKSFRYTLPNNSFQSVSNQIIKSKSLHDIFRRLLEKFK